MLFNCDGEPAFVQVQEAVKNRRAHEAALEQPLAHDLQADGGAERAVQEIKALITCLKIGLEARIGALYDAELAIMEWIIAHAAGLINRFLGARRPHSILYCSCKHVQCKNC